MDLNTIVLLVVAVITLAIVVLAVTKLISLSSTVEKLSASLPGEEMTAGFNAAADRLAEALSGATAEFEQALKGTASELQSGLGGATAAFEKAMKGTASELQSGLGGTTSDFEKALKGTASDMQSGLSSVSSDIQKSFQGAATEMQNALQGVSAQWKDELSAVLADHAQKITAAQENISAKLEAVTALAKDIEQVLALQKSVEGTVSQLAASEEFKAAIEALRKHLDESDKLLREAAKPRTIRLVESDDEVARAQ